jgi:excisionase family DNA binding protein
MKIINGMKLYSTRELADLLGVSYTTILKYIRDGKIIKTKIGHSAYVSEDNIIDYLNGRTELRRDALREISNIVTK